ncbi:unnamed protein product [Allacma fusca]|uniref:Ion transport peptide n=1 Tax=Allacma fusca TaxID=39272 RepID=A0A8J2K792_9HEXA|nr:unnamed protein product [Allacma fusca]
MSVVTDTNTSTDYTFEGAGFTEDYGGGRCPGRGIKLKHRNLQKKFQMAGSKGNSICHRSQVVGMLMLTLYVLVITLGIAVEGSRSSAAFIGSHPLSKRSFVSIQCRGTYDNEIFSKLSRVCDDCYNLYQEQEVHSLCRSNCFGSSYFKGCLDALLLSEEEDKFEEMIEEIHPNSLVFLLELTIYFYPKTLRSKFQMAGNMGNSICLRSQVVGVLVFTLCALVITMGTAVEGSSSSAAFIGSRPLSKRSFVSIQCRGTYDNEIFSKLSRVCDDCYNLYQEQEVHSLCRSNCFGSSYFKGCLDALLLSEEEDKFEEMIEVLGKK